MSGVLHLERIESAVGTGVPDISAAGGGKQFWIETKVEKSGYLYFERFQIPWMKKRSKYTNSRGIFVLALCEDTIKCFDAGVIISATREPYRKWSRIRTEDIDSCLWSQVKPWPNTTMEELAKLLVEKS